MSNLSDLLPAGAGGKQVDFVASGTLPSGQTVALKTNGQVEAVGELSQTVGSGVDWSSTTLTNWVVSVYDSSNNKIVVAYNLNIVGAVGTAIVGTVSGTTISFGSPVVFNAGNTAEMGIAYDSSNNKVVIAYRDKNNNSYGTAIVGTVSGTSISFGTAAIFLSALNRYNVAAYDSSNNKVVLSHYGASAYGQSVVGTVSGTSISFGATATFQSASTSALGSTYDSNLNKVVVVYSASSNAYAVVGTVSGTSISYGTPVSYEAGTVWSNAAVFDSTSNKVIIAYTDNGNSYYGTALVATVSGTTISFGTPVVFASVTSYSSGIGFDSNANKINIAYEQLNATTGKLIVGTVSGTTISFGTVINTLANGGTTTQSTFSFDTSNNKMVITCLDKVNNSSSTFYGTSFVFQNVSSNSTSFVGITDAAISSAASGSVTIKGGISSNVTGLTPNATYYVQNDGSLGSPTVSVPYNIAGAVYSQAFSFAAQEDQPEGLAFSPDGTKMFVIGRIGDDVNEFTLTTGFDVSTASYTRNFSIAAQETKPMGLAFNIDGTKMFVCGFDGDDVNEYALTTGFNVSTASFTDAFSVSGQDSTPYDIVFNTDGTKMFIAGGSGQDVNEYALTTGFDVSTASFTDAFSVSSQDTSPAGIAFNADGTEMFIAGSTNDKVFKYTLSTGFDVSTASYSSVSFSVASQDGNATGLAFSADGLKMFIVGQINDSVYQYSTGGGSVTTVLAGKALSSTSINLDYTT